MDAVDREMISKLQVDGRTTFREMAEIVGFTSMGVKKRFDSLQGRGIIKVSALLNPKPLNLRLAIVMLEMESVKAMRKLVERYRDCPRIIHMFVTLGGFNLIALVVAEDYDTLESISLEKCSLRSNEGIRRSEFYPIGDIYFSPFVPIREHLTHKERTSTPCNVDCRSCIRHKREKCAGCLATSDYRGVL